MKAVVIERPHLIRIGSIEKPKLLDNEVLLKPIRGGICGTDVHIYEGNFIGNYPVIPCHEFSGEIIEVGKTVEKFKPGDRVVVDPNIRCGICESCRNGKLNICKNSLALGVTSLGGFSELVNVPKNNAYKFESCSHGAAAFTEPLACVLYGQSRIKFFSGQQVIIWGAGAIGLLHLLVCKNIYNCDNITVVDYDEKKLELARKLGADNTIVSNTALSNKLYKNDYKWDIAIDATGSVKALSLLFKYLGRGGQALLFSVYKQKELLSISPFDIFLNDWKICGSLTYNNDFSSAVRILDKRIIQPEILIDRVIDFEEVPNVIKLMSEGTKFGKIQVKVN